MTTSSNYIPGARIKIEDVVKRSLELGVQTNDDKCEDFNKEQKFIGFIWNGRHSTVQLPTKKLEQRKRQIEEFLCTSQSSKIILQAQVTQKSPGAL
jgi:hypothetical protein